MYTFGQQLLKNRHFYDHFRQEMPVQVYRHGIPVDIGLITAYDHQFIEINRVLYHRQRHTFISRPGY
ncbi:hypothetical protein [Paenibacillus kandeliae]|uniref:hypothetical protein n=1 Tax=Paenibacillus kandeliae TaxID=3231269 RepID=UPI00345B1685